MKRKEILPEWIRFFAWLFLLGFLALPIFLLGLLGTGEVSLGIFGLSYDGNSSLHPIAIWVTIIATLAGFVSYGILWGKNWAITLGVIYGWLGLATSVIALILNMKTNNFSIEIGSILLIPFW